MFLTGLLILSPRTFTDHGVSQLLRSTIQHVKKNLYVYLAPPTLVSDPEQQVRNVEEHHIALTQALEQSILRFYATSASFCNHIDIRVILANIGECTKQKLDLKNEPEVVFAEKKSDTLLDYVKNNFTTASDSSWIEVSICGHAEANDLLLKAYDFTRLGGTFDRLHLRHKILLSKACLIPKKGLTVGVTDGDMNNGEY